MRKFILLLLLLLIPSCSSKDKTTPPNILFLLLDTLRADHLGCYGYQRNTSPNLDTLTQESITFEYAITAAPWTPPSITSLLTGLYPLSHGMMPPNSRERARKNSSKLNPNLDTLPERLSLFGYETAGFSSNPWISEDFGFNQGFQTFVFKDRARANEITDMGIAHLEKAKSDALPFFLYLHYLDPHDPYDPPGEYLGKYEGDLKNTKFNYPQKMSSLIGRYDGEISFLDFQIGRLFSYLKEKHLWDNLVVVVVGDHGEQFLEHGDHTHGFKLFNEEIHVPLLIRTGRWRDKGKVIKDTVSTIDVYPTILELAGVEKPTSLLGISLLDQEKIRARKGVLSEIHRHYAQKAFISADRKKLILEIPLGKKEKRFEYFESQELWKQPEMVGVFDGYEDSEEREKLKNEELGGSLRQVYEVEIERALKQKVQPGPGEGKEVPNETLDKLKSLGYL